MFFDVSVMSQKSMGKDKRRWHLQGVLVLRKRFCHYVKIIDLMSKINLKCWKEWLHTVEGQGHRADPIV